MKRLVVALMVPFSLLAADWLTSGGGPSRDNWQPREKGLTTKNISGLRLLWKLELTERWLTAPVILGPIITHRGIKELVFVEGASNTIYSVDADLGRVFWTRNMGAAAECANIPVTPAITPERVRTEEDGEGHTPMRPIYFQAVDGAAHKISPSTGADMEPPSAAVCGEPMTIKPFVGEGAATFSWQGREVVLRGKGQLLEGPVAGVATWVDTGGTRWIYSANAEGLQAWTFDGKELTKHWNATGVSDPLVANGMVFALTTGGAVHLNVLDAKTGSLLYSSNETSDKGGTLALANGHICFTSANTLYCFGLPIEI